MDITQVRVLIERRPDEADMQESKTFTYTGKGFLIEPEGTILFPRDLRLLDMLTETIKRYNERHPNAVSAVRDANVGQPVQRVQTWPTPVPPLQGNAMTALDSRVYDTRIASPLKVVSTDPSHPVELI